MGTFVNNGEIHNISLHIKQDGEKLSGRYAWDWISVTRGTTFGDFTGTIKGNQVNLTLKLIEEHAKNMKTEEMEMLLTYEPATAGDAAMTKDIVSKLGSLYGAPKDLAKELDSRQIMKLQGSLNYKIGTRDRMAIGFVPDISLGVFQKDKGN